MLRSWLVAAARICAIQTALVQKCSTCLRIRDTCFKKTSSMRKAGDVSHSLVTCTTIWPIHKAICTVWLACSKHLEPVVNTYAQTHIHNSTTFVRIGVKGTLHISKQTVQRMHVISAQTTSPTIWYSSTIYKHFCTKNCAPQKSDCWCRFAPFGQRNCRCRVAILFPPRCTTYTEDTRHLLCDQKIQPDRIKTYTWETMARGYVGLNTR